MKQLTTPLQRLILQVLLLLALYFISRVAFTAINATHFSGLNAGAFLRLAFNGIRYDLSAICAVNAPYIVLLFLPIPHWKWPRWERVTQIVFLICNSLALLFELSDWAYFPYNFKRATGDVLKMVSRAGDFWNVLPGYIVSYWYVPLAAALFITALVFVNRRICRATPLGAGPEIAHVWLMPFWQTVTLILVGGLAAIGIRGGLQYIPIGLRNAVQVTDSKYVPVVLNTPFSIITTLATPALEEVQYMSPAQAAAAMPFRHRYSGRPVNKKNVVLIILESGSKEFTSLGRKPSYMPFLDSLMSRSLVCTQAFANGQTSAEGIPAIIAGIPTLMDEAFTTSNYGTNRITALPGVLRDWGYSTAFYHGGTNGTMSFDIFSAAAGYDQYFGRSEFRDEHEYDGAWGIRDEPFLQYFARGMAQMRRPFFASVFTLSAHPPYRLPDEYKAGLPAGPLPVQQCIAYTDMALRKFFAAVAGQPWYDSTLFVITADHCSPQNGGGFYARGMGQYAIPLVLFAPGDASLQGYTDIPVQQLDILPSVLQYLGYDSPFFAYGNSLFSAQEPHFAITQASGAYQWLEDGYVLQTKGTTPVSYFAYPADSAGRSNLVGQPMAQKDSALQRLKAFIQQYQYTLIHNAMR